MCQIWKITPESLISVSLCTASLPNFSFLAVRMTTTPFEASCLHISNPIPLLTPVTTACLHARISKSGKLVYNICLLDSILLLLSRPSHGHLPPRVIVKNKTFFISVCTNYRYHLRPTWNKLNNKDLRTQNFPFWNYLYRHAWKVQCVQAKNAYIFISGHYMDN